MACEMCSTNTETFGADPARIQWKITRGDYSSLRVEFWEDDEVTPIDTSSWTFLSTAYNPVSGDLDTITVTPGIGYVDLSVLPILTATWGIGYSSVVAELPFDLQVTKPDDVVWTPVIGTICVLGDTTGGSL